MPKKGYVQSPEHVENNRKSHLGHKHTPETRAKMSATRKGRARTPEERAAISRGKVKQYKLNPKPKFLALADEITKDKLFNEYIVNGRSTRDIAKDFGVSGTTIKRYIHWYEIPMRPNAHDPDYKHKEDRSENYCRVAYEVHRIERKCLICGTTERIHIHHKDGNRKNNEKENLMPLCVSCHTYVHWRQWKGEEFSVEECAKIHGNES